MSSKNMSYLKAAALHSKRLGIKIFFKSYFNICWVSQPCAIHVEIRLVTAERRYLNVFYWCLSCEWCIRHWYGLTPTIMGFHDSDRKEQHTALLNPHWENPAVWSVCLWVKEVVSLYPAYNTAASWPLNTCLLGIGLGRCIGSVGRCLPAWCSWRHLSVWRILSYFLSSWPSSLESQAWISHHVLLSYFSSPWCCWRRSCHCSEILHPSSFHVLKHSLTGHLKEGWKALRVRVKRVKEGGIKWGCVLKQLSRFKD